LVFDLHSNMSFRGVLNDLMASLSFRDADLRAGSGNHTANSLFEALNCPRFLGQSVETVVWSFLSSGDVVSLALVSPSTQHHVRRYLASLKSLIIRHYDSLDVLKAALLYCRRLEVLDVHHLQPGQEFSAAVVGAVAKIITLNAAAFQYLCCDGADYCLDSPLLLQALNGCPSLRSCHIQDSQAVQETWAVVEAVLSKPSLRSFSLVHPMYGERKDTLDQATRSLTSLRYEHEMRDVSPLSRFPCLTSLALRLDYDQAKDLTPLQHPHLQSLTDLSINIYDSNHGIYSDPYDQLGRAAVGRFLRSRGYTCEEHPQTDVETENEIEPAHWPWDLNYVILDLPILKRLRLEHRASERIYVKSKMLKEAHFPGYFAPSVLLALDMVRDCDSLEGLTLEPSVTEKEAQTLFVELCARWGSSLRYLDITAVVSVAMFRAISQHCRQLETFKLYSSIPYVWSDWTAILALPRLKHLDVRIVHNLLKDPFEDEIKLNEVSKATGEPNNLHPFICPHLTYLRLVYYSQCFLDRVRYPALQTLKLESIRGDIYVDGLAVGSASSLQSLLVDTAGQLLFRNPQRIMEPLLAELEVKSSSSSSRHRSASSDARSSSLSSSLSSLSSSSCSSRPQHSPSSPSKSLSSSSASSSSSSRSSSPSRSCASSSLSPLCSQVDIDPLHPWSLFARLRSVEFKRPGSETALAMARYLPNLQDLRFEPESMLHVVEVCDAKNASFTSLEHLSLIDRPKYHSTPPRHAVLDPILSSLLHPSRRPPKLKCLVVPSTSVSHKGVAALRPSVSTSGVIGEAENYYVSPLKLFLGRSSNVKQP